MLLFHQLAAAALDGTDLSSSMENCYIATSGEASALQTDSAVKVPYLGSRSWSFEAKLKQKLGRNVEFGIFDGHFF
jgi:hypothetical protein